MNRADTLYEDDKKTQDKQHVHNVLHNVYYPEQAINIIANKQRHSNVLVANNGPESSTHYIYISL